MKRIIIVLCFFLSTCCISFGQETKSDWNFSVELGYRSYYEWLRKITSNHGKWEFLNAEMNNHGAYLGASANINRWSFPLEIGYSTWHHTSFSKRFCDCTVEQSNYYIILYDARSNYLTASIGVGFNLFSPSKRISLRPFFKFNPEFFLQRTISNDHVSRYTTATNAELNTVFTIDNFIKPDRPTKNKYVTVLQPSLGFSFGYRILSNLQLFTELNMEFQDKHRLSFGFNHEYESVYDQDDYSYVYSAQNLNMQIGIAYSW